MNIYESIMQGLNEAIAYEKGEKAARSNTVTIAPLPEVSASEIKELRQSLNMTQSTFAAVMGVSNKTVEAWEKHGVTLNTIPDEQYQAELVKQWLASMSDDTDIDVPTIS